MRQQGQEGCEAIVISQTPSMVLNMAPNRRLQQGQARPAPHHIVLRRSTLLEERPQDAGLVRTANGQTIHVIGLHHSHVEQKTLWDQA